MTRSARSGFALVEVMVAGAILAVISMGIAQMLVSQANNTTYLEFKTELPNVIVDMHDILSSPVNCMATFGAVDPNTLHTVTTIKKSGLTAYATGSSYDTNLVTIGLMVLGPATTAIPPSSSGTVPFHLKMNPARTQTGPKDYPRDVNIYAATDATGKLTTCSATPLAGGIDLTPITGAAVTTSISNLGWGATQLVHVTNDPTAKAVFVAFTKFGAGVDQCLGIKNSAGVVLYFVWGQVVSGAKQGDTGAVVLAPIISGGNISVYNTTACNSSHKDALSATVTTLAELH